ncbi:GDP-mannose 4,6-dehydratase [Candidatus Babeliales bacterium]|nr:GDP-mannose 4,6-dehydratase [Candidatus Babeliales bacterium]
MKIAIITGITGQDGAYLSKFLLEKKYKIVGFVRSNDDYSKLEYLKIKNEIIFEKCDLLNLSEIIKNIQKYNPREIYNFASQSSVSLSIKEPFQTLQFNIISVLNLLEAIRLIGKSIRFFQASSCEMFGKFQNIPTVENDFFKPLNPYAISKVTAHQIVSNYRKLYGIFSCCAILFNHESYLRGEDFFVKKIVKQAVEIKFGKRDFLKVGNLDIKRDLGYAPRYIEAMWLMLQQSKAEDFVISSGKSICLKDIVYYVFDKLGLKREKIIVDKDFFRKSDIPETLGDNSKAKKVLGWDYEMDFYKVLDFLISEEIDNQRLKYFKNKGIDEDFKSI